MLGQTEKMGKLASVGRRVLNYSRELFLRIKCLNAKGEVYQLLNKKSMHSLLLCLCEFQLVGTHSLVDNCAVFRLEPAHFSSLRVSELLKECTVHMHRDLERTT